jgi:ribonuclease T1
MKRLLFAVFAVLIGSTGFIDAALAREDAAEIAFVSIEDLPKEAATILALIKKGGPFKYEKDGAIFGNFEKRLPARKRGYYHEYTVPTPKAKNRGARRIIAGIPGEYYYTADHYNSFRRIKE